MYDQADELRQLARRWALARPTSERAPRLVAVTAGKGGVGVTTIAVNLAVALARGGRRTVLVDADLSAPDAAALCRLDDASSLADVLAGRRTIHEVLQPGPAGLQVVAGAWASTGPLECGEAAQSRLIASLRGLGAHADFVIIDIGSGQSPAVRRFWQACEEVLLVCSPDPVSIMDAYAAVKLQGGPDKARVRTVINQAVDDMQAAEVHARLERSCRRFLALEVSAAGILLADPRITVAGRERRPFVASPRGEDSAARMESLAELLASASSQTDPAGLSASRPATSPPRPHRVVARWQSQRD
jgi:flagellar biosynthesis protein FlhG